MKPQDPTLCQAIWLDPAAALQSVEQSQLAAAGWSVSTVHTLDELFETLTLIQTGKCRKRPILLFGRDFWTKLINLDHLVETGMISPEDVNLFRYVESAEEAWGILRNEYGLGKPDDIACGW